MGPVQAAEKLCRHIVTGGKYKPSKKKAHYSHFIPNKNHKTSVFRVGGLSDQEIWDLGDKHVAPARGRPVVAKSEVSARFIFDQKLEISPSEPLPYHADIINWPEDEELRVSIATKIAEEAELTHRESSGPTAPRGPNGE